jgi:ankyrin repeat protein
LLCLLNRENLFFNYCVWNFLDEQQLFLESTNQSKNFISMTTQQNNLVELLAQHVSNYFQEKLKFAPDYENVLKHCKRMEKKNPEGFKLFRSILKNIHNNPDEIKYRKIKKSNKKINDVLCEDFKFLLGQAGWNEDELELNFPPEDIEILRGVLNLVEDEFKTPEEKKVEFFTYLSNHKHLSEEDFKEFEQDFNEQKQLFFMNYLKTISNISYEKSVQYMKLFISHGLNILDSSFSLTNGPYYLGNAMTYAIGINSLRSVEILLELGYDVNAEDLVMGMTPLCVACIKKNIDEIKYQWMLKYLIQKGADVNLKTKKGLLPLGYAVTQGSPSAVEILCANGSIVDKEMEISKSEEVNSILEKYKK